MKKEVIKIMRKNNCDGLAFRKCEKGITSEDCTRILHNTKKKITWSGLRENTPQYKRKGKKEERKIITWSGLRENTPQSQKQYLERTARVLANP